MMVTLRSLILLLVAPLLLTSCLLSPGRFTSEMIVHADRSFTYSYKGEVIAFDMDAAIPIASVPEKDAAEQTDEEKADAKARAEEATTKKQATEKQRREIAEALLKEEGYRSVVYKGNGLFQVDYSITGTLTNNFIYPFNTDAGAIIPFIAIELRKDGTARIKAPAFGESNGGMPGAPPSLPGAPQPGDKAEGVFTLKTDAEIISQNNEAGAKQVGLMKVISWTVGAIKKPAPTVVVRFAK